MKRIMGFVLMGLLISAFLSGCRQGTDQYMIDDDNRLVIYTSHKEEVYRPIVDEFEDRTGIVVTVEEGGTVSLMSRIADEAASPSCDIMFGGGVDNYDAYRDCFEPYFTDESDCINSDFLSEDGIYTPFSLLPTVFVYNNKLIYSPTAPSSWEKLLSGEYKGKIAFASPLDSGSCYTALCTMMFVCDPSHVNDYISYDTFMDNLNGDVSSGSGAILEEVDSGEKAVGITLEETARKRMAEGADISLVYPEDGTSVVPDATAIVKNAPHPDNAARFMEFCVSPDVQQLIVDKYCRRTVRNDITDRAKALNEINIIDYDVEWAATHKEEILFRWKEYMEGDND